MQHGASNSEPRLASPGQRSFATTHWSLVLAVQAKQPEQARQALERLCRLYWFPLYAWARQQGHKPVDAEDFTQGFISHLLGSHFFHHADPARGRFRSYLLASFRHYLADENLRATRLKRGQGRPLLSLDQPGIEERYRRESPEPFSPDQLYERRWALTVIETVLQRLGEEAAEAGHAELFAQTRETILGDHSGLPYAEVGRRLGLSEGALATAIHRLRARYRELFREEIAHTVSSPGEVDDEVRHLFQVLGG
ncbi:MAG: RNA polymerase sigma factor [Limisphaerales bacterium]